MRYQHQTARGGRQGHRRKVTQGVIGQLFVNPRIDGKRTGGHQQRVTIRIRLGDDIRTDDAVGSRATVGDDLLFQPFGQPVSQKTSDTIHRAANGRRNKTHRLQRIVLRVCREYSRAREQERDCITP